MNFGELSAGEDRSICYSNRNSSNLVTCYGEDRCCCYSDSYHFSPSCCSCSTYWWFWLIVTIIILTTIGTIVVMYLRRKTRLAKFEQLLNQSLFEPNRNLVQGPDAERKFDERFNEIRYEPPRH